MATTILTSSNRTFPPSGVSVYRLRAINSAAILTIGWSARAHAQQPSLSGSWVATRESPTSVAVAPSAIFGDRFALTISERDVSITRLLRGTSLVSVLPVNGTEVRTAIPGRSCMGDGATLASLSRAGDALTYSQATLQAGVTQPSPSLKYVIRLESPDRLVVESTLRTSAQAAPTQVGTRYRRTTDPMPVAPTPSDVRGVSANIANVSWLVGDWEGPMGASTVQERWTTAAGGAMLALSRTTRASTMSAFENPSHDFPKQIRYVKRADGSMAATISGATGERATTFVFTRRGSG